VKPYKPSIVFTLFLSLLFACSSFAEVDWQVQKTLNLKEVPVDVVMSSGGSYLYVLTDDGTVYVYTASGTLKGQVQVGKDINSITAGPGDDIIFAKNEKDKTVQRILIDFIYDFHIEDSPFKGNPDAPVSIVVFSDYQ
jgi:hypothetical protein